MNEKLSTEEGLKKIRKEFSFSRGPIVNIYLIGGEFQIIELGSKSEVYKKEFYSYVNFEATHKFSYIFDQALVDCLSYKYEGNTGHAASYICKMLGMLG